MNEDTITSIVMENCWNRELGTLTERQVIRVISATDKTGLTKSFSLSSHASHFDLTPFIAAVAAVTVIVRNLIAIKNELSADGKDSDPEALLILPGTDEFKAARKQIGEERFREIAKAVNRSS